MSWYLPKKSPSNSQPSHNLPNVPSVPNNSTPDWLNKLGTNKVNYVVPGLGTIADQARLEGALYRLPGIVAVYVNMATKKVSISYSPYSVHTSAILQALTQAGFTTVLKT